jgi:hypothetical protein
MRKAMEKWWQLKIFWLGVTPRSRYLYSSIQFASLWQRTTSRGTSTCCTSEALPCLWRHDMFQQPWKSPSPRSAWPAYITSHLKNLPFLTRVFSLQVFPWCHFCSVSVQLSLRVDRSRLSFGSIDEPEMPFSSSSIFLISSFGSEALMICVYTGWSSIISKAGSFSVVRV